MELWLRGSLRELALQTLSRARLQKFGLLNIETVPNLVQQTLRHESSEHIPVVWALLVLQLWCEAYLA